MKIFNKNTIKCDRCGDKLNLKKDKAYCFHSDEQEVYICIPCVREVYTDYVKFNGDGKFIPDEEPN